jgi:ATP-dependent Clp protease adaptor protein ClpS
MAQRWLDEENEILTEQETREKIETPRLFKVLLHNDNYTTMDFVVMILQRVFHKPETDAVRIMLDVHYKAVGVVGLYPREVAETKCELVRQLAQDAQFPLLCTMEPE